MSGFIDTHAHLHDRAFNDDRAAALDRARAAGVEAVVTVGTDIKESEAAVALAAAQPDVYAVVGLHPHDAKDWQGAVEERLRTLAETPDVVAVGEIGLDFHRNLSPPSDQEHAFQAQLELANTLALPVVIHSREAHEETYSTLRAWAATAACDSPLGVVHCFSGDAELALRYIEIGFVISFAGPVTFPKSSELRGAAVAVPGGAIVVETDCPYLTPQYRRGQRNEPAHVTETGRVIAELRGEPVAEFAARSSANARRLFRLAMAETISR
ncbi:MAG: TatD family hydrolase [Dehalococcoidia bacterium]